jgi:hypothetical protein
MFVSSVSFGQNAKEEIEKAMDAFDNALMLKDSNALKTLLHDTVQYKHSNGWIQTKREVIGDFFNGKIEYESIAVEQPIVFEEKNGKWLAKYNAAIKGAVNSTSFEVYLNVVQTWMKINGSWVLVRREAKKQEASTPRSE